MSVQMFSRVIFTYLNCFNLFETNVTESIKPLNYFYHAIRPIMPRSQYASLEEFENGVSTLKTLPMFFRPHYARNV